MQGKATLSKMAAKHPREAERRVNGSLVSTKAVTRRKSNLWALLELFGFGHSNKHYPILNTALWQALVRVLGPGLRTFVCSFLLTWLSCDGSVCVCKRGQQRVVFLIDVHLTSFFVELLEIAVPGVAATTRR
jgi:hypothetical protein